jgi:hypothetical protein
LPGVAPAHHVAHRLALVSLWYPNGKRCSEPACFKTPGIGVWKVAPAEKRERLLKSDGWTFERFGPGGTSQE